MSSLARTLRSTRAPQQLLRSQRCAAARFHNSSISRALSEADHADSKSNTQPKSSKIETHKQDSVSRAKTGQGEWKPELASQSEQDVRGDKSDMSMKEMQEMGQKKAKE